MADPEPESRNTDEDSVPATSPLVEHYDAFRSLCLIHKALLNDGFDELEESDPFRQWVRDTLSMIDEDGFGEQPTGYGGQLKNTNRVNISEYRDKRGNENRLTSFECINVTHPSPVVLGLLNNRMSDLDTWHVPISPDSETPIPILVETEIELKRARALLAEFQPSPPVLASSGNRATGEIASSDSVPQTPADGEPASDQTETQMDESDKSSSQSQDIVDTEDTDIPVQDVRGVSSAVAEALVEAGYETRADLTAASDQELASIDGLSQQRVTLIRAVVGSG